MLYRYLTSRKDASCMLRLNSRGHILLEALVGCALALSASAALWKLASSAQHLAKKAATRTLPKCPAPECQRDPLGYVCVCNQDSFSIIE